MRILHYTLIALLLASAALAQMTKPLDGEWTVSAITAGQVDPDNRPTLTFEDGMVFGTTGCNRYRGSVTLAADSLTFGPMASTMMACPDPLMDQEQVFIAALGLVTGYALTETGLDLLDADGAVILSATR